MSARNWLRLIAFAPLLAPIASAQWSADPRIGTPVDTSEGLSLCYGAREADSHTMLAGDGGMACIWERRRRHVSDTGSFHLQRFTRDGHRSWPMDGITAGGRTLVGMSQFHNMAVVDDGSGGTIAAVTGRDSSSVGPAILLYRYDVDGRPRWGAAGIRLSDASGPDLWDLLPDGSGGAIAVFTTAEPSIGVILRVQRVDSNGVPQWSDPGLAVSPRVALEYPQSMADGAGGVVCSWRDSLGVVCLQRLDAAGRPQWSANGVRPDRYAGWHWPGCLTTDGAGGTIVTWRDDHLPTIPLMAQRIDAVGQRRWGPDGVQLSAGTTATPALWWGSVVSDMNGGIIAIWYDWDRASIRGQRIDSLGALRWAPDGVRISDRAVSPTCHGMQWAGNNRYTIPQAVSDDAGGAIVAYETCETGRSSGVDIEAQRVNADGVCLWQSGGVPVATADSTQQNTRVAADGAGGAYVLWDDERRGWTECDLYAAHLCPDGTLGDCGSASVPVPASPAARIAVHPNPFTATATISYETAERGATQVAVIDLLGRLRAVPVDRVQEPGGYTVSFDASALAAGLYCCVLRTPTQTRMRMISIVK